MKTTHFLRSALAAIAIAFCIVESSNTYAQSSKQPNNAIVERMSGAVTINSQPIVRPFRPIGLDQERTVQVPPSSSSEEHWIHLQFRSDQRRIPPLVQAGPDRGGSEYTFPCYVQKSAVIGFQRVLTSNRGCVVITVSSGSWREKGKAAQSESEDITITRPSPLTVIYIQRQDDDSVAINVLTGKASVRLATSSKQYVLTGGTQLVDRGSTSQITLIPREVYNSRPVQIFLDPTTWSDEVGPNIQDFQTAVKEQLAVPPPITPGRVVIPDPNPNPPSPGNPEPPSPEPSTPTSTPAPAPAPAPTPTPTEPFIPR